MRPFYHFIFSLLGALIFFILTDRVWPSLVLFLTGFFIDLDHLIDYWTLKPAQPFSLKKFLDSEKYDQQKKFVFVFLHSYEWLILLWFLVWLKQNNLFLLAAASGASLHLLFDVKNIVSEKTSPLMYFFVFRCFKKFKKNEIYR